jgi:PAS domain S-box-containing protein
LSAYYPGQASVSEETKMSKKALVVDNDFFFVEFLTEILEQRGYEVIKAYDGKEGISKLEAGAVDLLFVDLVMPKIDGNRFIKFTRKKFPDGGFPVIAVSGTIIEQLDVLNEIGADYYIAKGPIEIMADHVNRFMDRIEKAPLPSPNGENILEPGKIHPRKVTAELMETMEFQRAITESIGIGIIVVDRDARITNANSFALSIISKSLEEVLNCPITAIFPAREKAKLVGALKRVIQNQELGKTAISVTMRSQEIRVIVSPFKMDGKIIGWIMAMEEAING